MNQRFVKPLEELKNLATSEGEGFVVLNSETYVTFSGDHGEEITLDDAGYGTVRFGDRLNQLFWLPEDKSILDVVKFDKLIL